MPGDLVDVTFLADYQPGMSTEDLIKVRTQQLLRLPEDVERARRTLSKARIASKESYEQKFARRLRLEEYEPGALVLIHNNPIKNSVSIQRKTADRYMGPYSVIRKTQGGSYILAELDGSLLRHHVAAYRLIPYVQRKNLEAWTKQAQSGSEQESGSFQEMSDNGNQDSHQASTTDEHEV